MSEVVKRCAACGKENPVREMKTCMHSQMHYYVCNSKCMDDFYNPPKKPTDRELRIKAETERDAALAELAALKGGQEAVAMLRYARNVPGFENEMPHVVSCNDMPDGLYAVYATQPAQASAWVPVSERLPAETYAYGCHTDDVLCRTRSGKLIIAMLAQTTTGPVWYDQQSQERDVTHWQPLPAAPTPGASDGKEV